MKQKHIRGIESTIEGDTGELLLANTAGVGIKCLEIQGNTFQADTPTPDAPVPIQNTGDNGVEVVVKGKNLFDIDTVFGEMGGWTKQSDTSWYRINVGQVYQKVLFTNTSQKNGKLTLLVNQRTATTDESKKGIGYVIVYTDGSTDILQPKVSDTFQYYTITTDESKTVDRIQFTYNYNFPTYIKEIMISWGEPSAYEPYVEHSITAPVTLCGIGEDKDTLTIDWQSRKVKKHTKIKLYAFTGEEEIEEGYGDIKVKLPLEAYPSSSEYPYGKKCYCTHFLWAGENNRGTNSIECDFDCMYVYQPTLNGKTFQQFLKENYENGTPVQITYVSLDEYIEDADTELSELTTPYNQDVIIEVQDAGVIKATYYSLEKEDKLSLTVHYKNGEGEALKNSDIYSVRKCSRYLVIPPQIEGYEPFVDKIEGYLTEDREIIITYKEK